MAASFSSPCATLPPASPVSMSSLCGSPLRPDRLGQEAHQASSEDSRSQDLGPCPSPRPGTTGSHPGDGGGLSREPGWRPWQASTVCAECAGV